MDTLTHMKAMMTSLGPLVGLVAVWFLGMPIFAYQHNRRGRPESERVSKAGGSVLLGRWLILFGSMLDALDGIVAREMGVSSDAGEFLDAIVDRYCEIAGYIGLCYYYNERPFAMAAVLGALLGSLMVSY